MSEDALLKIEGPAAAFGFPYIPEHDLAAFRLVRRPELAAALAAEKDPLARGLLRRATGDRGGALADFQAALDRDPGSADALAGLGACDLRRPEAETALSRALAIDPAHAAARLQRAAARLLAGRAAAAKEDLEVLTAARTDLSLAYALLGAAEERLKSRARAYAAYDKAAWTMLRCSAFSLLASRAAPSLEEELAWLHRAYDFAPVLGFITLQIHRTSAVDSPAYARKLRALCFARPDEVGSHYQREAVPSRASYYPFDDRRLVREMLKKRPDTAWINAFYGRAACYSKDGLEDGVAHLTRAAELQPGAGWIRAWRGNARKAAGDEAGALEDFESSIRAQPHYHRAYVWRGAILSRKGETAAALADFDRALPLDPHYPLTYFERARARRASGDMAGAASDMARAFALDERYSWARMAAGGAAIAELETAASALPGEPALRVWLGELRLRRGPAGTSGAILDFEAAAETDPQNALAHACAGRALFEAGSHAKAAARLERAAALDPGLHAARLWLAEALDALGRGADALAVLRDAVRARPLSPRAHYLAATFAKGPGRARAAEKALATALNLDGKFAEAYLLLSAVRLEKGDAEGALDAAEHCVRVAPNLGRAYLARAAARTALGRADGAVADWKRVLAEFPYLLNAEQRASAEALLA